MNPLKTQLALESELKAFHKKTGFTLHTIVKSDFLSRWTEKHIQILQNQSSPDILLIFNPKKKQFEIRYHKKLKSFFSEHEINKCLNRMEDFFNSTHPENAIKLSILEIQRLF